MINTSAAFQAAAKDSTKQLKAYIGPVGDQITEADDLQTLKISANSDLTHTVMRYAEAFYFGTHGYLNKYIQVGLGIVLPNTTTEYINYGSFKVTEITQDKNVEGTRSKMFDKMYEALQQYDLQPVYDITYPTTLLGLLQAICTRLGWTLATTTFPNSTLAITTDLFIGLGMSFRDVMDDIAEASGSIIYFKNDDTLAVRQIAQTSIDTLDQDTLNSLKILNQYGPIRSVVLSRQPQNDNIAQTS